YHAFEVNLNKRFSGGWTLLSNYTWSRTLGEDEGDSLNNQEILNDYRNGRNRRIDKRLLAFHRTHVLRNSGLWDLPVGPNRRFFGDRPGALSRLIGGWQIGGIFNAFSGPPIGLSADVSSFNQDVVNNTPTLVGALPKNTGQVKRTDNGVVYFDG